MAHETLRRWANTPLRPLLELGMSLVKTTATRRATWIHRDRDSDWIQAHARAWIASPDLHLKRFESIEAKARRLWFRHHRPQEGEAVVDGGAGIGEDTILFSRAVGTRGRVLAIEAHPRVSRCLRKTVAGSRLANVTTFECAIHSNEGEIVISDDELHAASTTVGTSGETKVRARTLPSILDEAGVDRIGLLKLNVEGAEADVLETLGPRWASVQDVVVSCHDFLADRGGSPSFRTRERVLAILRARDFEILSGLESAPEDWARGYVWARRVVSGLGDGFRRSPE